MKDYLAQFCERFGYPKEAQAFLLDTYEKLTAKKEVSDQFHQYIKDYQQKRKLDYQAILEELKNMSEVIQVPYYTIHLLFFMCLSQEAHKRYQEKNISEQIYFDSMCDLKWKLFECYHRFQIWGSFVAWWFPRFFELETFALGRLQFELVRFGHHYEKNGFVLTPEDTVINVHIPSSGPLLHDEVIAAYEKAKEFFADSFAYRPIPFVCDSWLLFPKHREILGDKSNIVQFLNDFDLIETREFVAQTPPWTVYLSAADQPINQLPTDTVLRKAYTKRIQAGEPLGSAYGIMLR